MPLNTFEFFNGERPPLLMLAPTISRSVNQSPEKRFYDTLPITTPNSHEPIHIQFDRFLSRKIPRQPLGQDAPYGPFGSLGKSQHPDVMRLKHRLAQLPPIISLEARAVFLTTLLGKFHSSTLGIQHGLPPTYDYGRDRYLAQDVYGGNGLYKAAEEWTALSQGKYPGIPHPVNLSWTTMHIRHTLLNNAHLREDPTDFDTRIELIAAMEPHFRERHETPGEYLKRMSQVVKQSELQLQNYGLLPAQDRLLAAVH